MNIGTNKIMSNKEMSQDEVEERGETGGGGDRPRPEVRHRHHRVPEVDAVGATPDRHPGHVLGGHPGRQWELNILLTELPCERGRSDDRQHEVSRLAS